MWAPGVPSCIIRFICHIPAGMMGFNGKGLYDAVDGLGDIYNVIPHGKDFLGGLKIICIAGICTFAWNFFQFIASGFCQGSLLGLVGLVDLALTIALIMGVVKQAKFLPQSYGPCDGAPNWNNGTDGRNFFVMANQTEGIGYDSPESLCKNMVLNWTISLVVIGFYGACVIANLSLGFGESLFSSNRRRSSWSSTPYSLLDMFSCLLAPLRMISRPFFQVINHLQGPTRLTFRFLSKYFARNRGANTTAAHTKEPNKKRRDGTQPTNEKEAASTSTPRGIRLPLELVMLITRDLHFSDLVNLHRSSKSLRKTFFGDFDTPAVLRSLRQFACSSYPARFSCAICSMQTCNGCQTSHNLPSSNAFRHLRECRAVCTKCFYKRHCLWVTDQHDNDAAYWATRSRLDRAQNLWDYRHSPAGANNRDVEMSAGDLRDHIEGYSGVCRICAQRSDQENTARREEENRRELQRLGRMPLCCWWCKWALPDDGVRWWWDPMTERECKWEGHVGWVKG